MSDNQTTAQESPAVPLTVAPIPIQGETASNEETQESVTSVEQEVAIETEKGEEEAQVSQHADSSPSNELPKNKKLTKVLFIVFGGLLLCGIIGNPRTKKAST